MKRLIPGEFEELLNGNERYMQVNKERTRVAKACESCKRKKIKCNGVKPCAPCLKSSIECVYNSHHKSHTPNGEDGKLLSNSHLQDYTTGALLERMRVLEKVIEDKQHVKLKKEDQLEIDKMRFISEISDDPNLDKFRYSKRFLVILSNILGNVVYGNLSSSSQNQVKVPRVQGYGWNMSGVHYLCPKEIEHPFKLEPNMERRLLNYFFDHVNPLHVVLHKPVFMKQYEMCLNASNKDNTLLLSSLCNLACALGMRFSEVTEREQYPRGLEEKLFESAYSVLQDLSFQWESIELVQGWLLCTLYLRTCHRQSSTWMALGQALRLCHSMGLMKKYWLKRTSPYEAQKGNRVFWACYTLDRFLSLDLGRSFAIKEVDVTLPVPTEYVDDGWITQPAYGLIRLAAAISPLDCDNGSGLTPSVLDSIGISLHEWNAEMQTFGLGADVGYADLRPDLDPALICQFRLQYQDAICYTYMRTVFGLVDSKWQSSVSTNKEEALEASKNIVKSLNDLGRTKHFFSCWWLFLSCLHNAIVIMLTYINAGYAEKELLHFLATGIKLVDSLVADGRFFMSKECQWSLRTLNHMVYLRLEETKKALRDAGIEHGDSKINERRFASMGLIGKDGKVLPPQKSSTSPESIILSPQVSPQNARNSDNNDTQQQSSNVDKEAPPKEPQQAAPVAGVEEPIPELNIDFPYSGVGGIPHIKSSSSVDWFKDWSWDIDTSMATYLNEYQE